MHTGTDQILNFSNPNVKYCAVATGEPQRFNACRIQEYGCGVSGLTSSPVCRIKANPTFNCAQKKLILTSELKKDDGTACSVFYWEFEHSFDGINYFPGSITFFPTYTISYSGCPNTIFVRIKAFDNGGNLINSSYEWYNIPIKCLCVPSGIGGGGGPKPLNTFYGENQSNPSVLRVYPNPANSSINILLSSKLNGDAQVSIFDINGQKVLNFENTQLQKVGRTMTLDVSSLLQGAYFITISSDSTCLTKQFIKL